MNPTMTMHTSARDIYKKLIMMTTNVLAAVVVLVCMCTVSVAFQSSSWSYTSQNRRELKVKPLHENFFLDIAEDPAANTPRQVRLSFPRL